MNATITIELPEKTKAALDKLRDDGDTPNKFIVKALEDYIFIRRFRNLRERMTAEAEKNYNDEEIFDLVS
jgi:predicted transcriptional regulator